MFISKRANGVYYIYYNDDRGKRQAISTKTKIKSESLKFLTDFNNQIIRKREKEYAPINLIPFSLEYLKHSEAVHTFKTTRTFNTTFRFFIEFFGNVPLIQITEKDISRYLDNRIISSSIFMARKDLINISSFFNWAISECYVNNNPCKNVKKVKVPQKMPLFFSKEELKTLLDNIPEEDIKDLITFAVNTGCRQMEILTVEWRQIDFENRILMLDNRNHITKSKKVRSIPLNNSALSVLLKRRINQYSDGLRVFTLKGNEVTAKQIQTKMRVYIKESGLNNKLNFHSLRHTFASWLVQKGVSIYEVSKLLGHSDIKVTQIYAHLSNNNLLNSVNLI